MFRPKRIIIGTLILLAAMLLILGAMYGQRMVAWVSVQRILEDHASIVPEIVVSPTALLTDDVYSWHWEEAGFVFRTPWPVERVDQGLRMSRLDSQYGGAIVNQMDQVDKPPEFLPWCELLKSQSGRDELLQEASRIVLDLVGDGDPNVLAGSDRLEILFFLYHQAPNVSLLRSFRLTEAEWTAHYLSMFRKSQFEAMIQRGLSIVVFDEYIVVARHGRPDFGNAVDALVFSCDGSLLFSVIANGEPPEESSDDFLFGLLSSIDGIPANKKE